MPETDTVLVTMTKEELLAALAGLPDNAPMFVTLNGDGPRRRGGGFSVEVMGIKSAEIFNVGTSLHMGFFHPELPVRRCRDKRPRAHDGAGNSIIATSLTPCTYPDCAVTMERPEGWKWFADLEPVFTDGFYCPVHAAEIEANYPRGRDDFFEPKDDR
jgi:hypothetical protein